MSSLLDPGQIVKEVFNDSDNAINVSIVSGVSLTAAVEVDASDGDSILATGSTDGTASGTLKVLKVDSGGAVQVGDNGATLSIDDGAGSITVDATSLPLPTGASTEATLSTLNGKVTAVNTGAVVVSSSALPSGASTSANQDTGNTSVASIDTKTPALGQALAAASVPVVLTAAQLTTLTPLATVAATQSGNWSTRTQDGSGNAITSTSSALDVNVKSSSATAYLDVVDFIDTTPVLVTSSTNIPASGSAVLTVVASLAAAAKKIKIDDTTGAFIGIYEGATLVAVSGPGSDATIEVQLAAGAAVAVRNMANATISSGSYCLQFLG